jgi:hypothetical protein
MIFWIIATLATSQNPQKKTYLGIIADSWVGVSEFFIGEFSPNFYLKNMILTYTKDFSFLKMAQLSDFEKTKFQIAKFLCQKVAKNMERFFFF